MTDLYTIKVDQKYTRDFGVPLFCVEVIRQTKKRPKYTQGHIIALRVFLRQTSQTLENENGEPWLDIPCAGLASSLFVLLPKGYNYQIRQEWCTEHNREYLVIPCPEEEVKIHGLTSSVMLEIEL